MTAPTPPLPEVFVRRMERQLGPEAEAYFAAMAKPCARGLRLNPRKPLSSLREVEGLLSPIPWEPDGRYLSLCSQAGAHPLHEAGAYYLQEPSAMIPARVLRPQKGERILDLCAAPGGKSTQLSGLLEGGLLVCNEPSPSRAQVLSRNLERMGATHALVVCSDPERLAEKWPQAFDAILADAPCSGEGMFRRHPETRLEWDEAAPARCAARQLRILDSAARMLRPGGRLLYSTCTLNREENEGTVAALLEAHPELRPVDFAVPLGNDQVLASRQGMLRVLPHQIQGEGHFVALLKKEPEGQPFAAFLPPDRQLKPPSAALLSAYQDFAAGKPLPQPNAQLGDLLLSAPPLPPLDSVRVLRAGVHLGQLKGKTFIPDHALAMAMPCPWPAMPLSLPQARAYQRGETLPAEESLRGFVLATYEGLALGLGKASEGQLKNHYPKGLRRP